MNKYENIIGKILDGRYKILEPVGVGGMAFVLKAEDLVMNRVVAVKILNEQYNGDYLTDYARSLNEIVLPKKVSEMTSIRLPNQPPNMTPQKNVEMPQ